MKFEEKYRKLGFIGKDGFTVLSDPEWASKVTLSNRVLDLIQDPSGPLHQMSAMFVFGGRPLIFFFENPREQKQVFKTIWNLNEVPIVVFLYDNHVNVYNGFKYEKELGALSLLGNNCDLDNFEYFKIVTGRSWEEYKSSLGYHNRVDYFLLKNIESAQRQIQILGVPRNLANCLIGKLIFLRYLTDRHVKVNFEGRKQVLTNADLIELLQDKKRLADLFETLQDKNRGFNGDLFKISREDLETIPDGALRMLVRLLRSEDLEDNTCSLFDVYDFSILPIEFISNVYERFIGKENQEREGAYYTPYFLVDYIINNTVGCHLANAETSSCKVLDPACGSGIFLVETLRRIIDHYRANAVPEKLQGKAFQDTLRKLAKDNIFGIDSDESAIQVAAFSIYLTLLDYQKPADISTFRFPSLIGSNLICNDSFTDIKFNDFKFDYIIGNPPWNRGRKELDDNGDEIEFSYKKYIKRRSREEGIDRIIGNEEIAQAFVVRSLDFMSTNTRAALVLTSKILYNNQSSNFRSYLLKKVLVDSILELSSVRKEVFSQSSDPSVAPACVLFYQRKLEGVEDNGHLVTHMAVKPSVFFTLFKVLTVEKADIQNVRQDLLAQYDFLWKILLYGSYLDFIFVKRLKGMTTILQMVNFLGYVEGQGVIRGNANNRSYDISHRIGKRKIEARDLCQYEIAPSDATWQLSHAQRGRQDILFQAPLLLVRKSTGADFSCRAAIINEDVVYLDAITGIHGDNLDVLRNIAGVLNSDLFRYYALMNLSSIGTEREQGHNIEKFSLPYVSGDIAFHVERVELLKKELTVNPILHSNEVQTEIEKEVAAINDCIFKELNMTVAETALVDYAVNYTIPLVTGKSKVKIIRNNALGRDMMQAYADVFNDRFNGQFGEGIFVSYECGLSDSYIILRFIVSNEKREPVFENSDINAIEKFLLSISAKGLSDNLYLRKDIRGFEENGFYIVKPNEQRLWHPAIAYVDVEEFVDAMMSKDEA